MKNKTLITWLIILIGGAGTLYALGYIPASWLGESEDELAKGDQLASLYLPLEPTFVVNFTHQGTLRYLQISIEVMYHHQRILDEISQQMPAVRNDLILLFSDQKYEKLSTLAGKEILREEIKSAINQKISLDEELLDTGEVYITNFVMQ